MAMHLDDDTLQRYFDGELSPADEQRIRNVVASDPEAQTRLAELARLSQLVQDAFDARAGDLDADALFANIERGIDKAPELTGRQRLRLVASEWTEHRKGVVVPLFAAAAMAAAALLVFLVPHGGEQTARAPQSAPEPAVAASHGSSIEEVDFGASSGTVFEVESEGVSAAVVWIADDEENAP